MIHPSMNEKLTVRSVFIIGPDKKVKLIITYPQTTGRNIDEVLRVIDSLQLTAGYSVATPVDWQQGGDVIIAGVRQRRGGQGEVPRGLEGREALPPLGGAAEQEVTPARRAVGSDLEEPAQADDRADDADRRRRAAARRCR